MSGWRAGSDKAQLSEELQKGFFPAPLLPPRRACTPPMPPSSAPDYAGIRRLPPWEGPFMAGAMSWGVLHSRLAVAGKEQGESKV